MIDSECDSLERWGGLPVLTLPGYGFEEMGDWPGGREIPSDVEQWAWSVAVAGFEGLGYGDLFQAFLRDVDTTRVGAFVIGNWVTNDLIDQDAAEVFEPLIAAADRFPNLRHLFVGDIEAQQFEISWIHQSDLTPLLRAFPNLGAGRVDAGRSTWP